MPQRTSYTPQSSLNPFDFDDDQVDVMRDNEFFLDVLGCDDFWWDEEERHELF